jgi:hypothetical protein
MQNKKDLRPIEIAESFYNMETKERVYKPIITGFFHSFICDSDANCFAICELENGKVQLVNFNSIRFLDRSVKDG